MDAEYMCLIPIVLNDASLPARLEWIVGFEKYQDCLEWWWWWWWWWWCI